MTRPALGAALAAIDAYLEPRAAELFAPILSYLDEAGGEPRSTTEIAHYFRRYHGMEDVVIACEWLAGHRRPREASTPVKLTTRSQIEVEELAFFRIQW